jgi:hypothetical protein
MYLKLIITAALSIPWLLAATFSGCTARADDPPPLPAWSEALKSLPREFRSGYCQRFIDHEVQRSCQAQIAMR